MMMSLRRTIKINERAIVENRFIISSVTFKGIMTCNLFERRHDEMTDDEIMEIYRGWDDKTYAAIKEYVSMFHQPWPVYGPHDIELIECYIKKKMSIDDLLTDDEIYDKYYKGIIY